MMSQFRRKSTAVIAALALSAVVIAPTTAQAQSRTISVPIVGAVDGGGTFAGAFALTRFAVRNGQVVALGTLTGILTDAAGVATSAIAAVAMPVVVATPVAIAAVCQILHLDIGPIALDLLGLQVNLSRVVLDITAQSGAAICSATCCAPSRDSWTTRADLPGC